VWVVYGSGGGVNVQILVSSEFGAGLDKKH